MRQIALILMALFMAACAASGEQRDRFEEIAVYERHAGAAETWVRYTSIRNWWAVGFHSVVFEVNRSRHYLVNLIGSCSLDLDSAMTLRLVSTRRNVLSEFDKVIVGGQTCQVQSIHPLDYEAVEAEFDAEDESLPEGQGNVSVESEGQPSGGM